MQAWLDNKKPRRKQRGMKRKQILEEARLFKEAIMQERIDVDETGEDYSQLLESIRQNMDPNNNTAILIDDERGIRKMVARNLKNFAPNLQIYEASNGKEGLAK